MEEEGISIPYDMIFNMIKSFVQNYTDKAEFYFGLLCTVVFKVDQDCESGIAAGGLRSLYLLDEIQFHWGAEHTIQDKRSANYILI